MKKTMKQLNTQLRQLRAEVQYWRERAPAAGVPAYKPADAAQ